MIGRQHHRGPDDVGETLVDAGEMTLGLGHRRLSILDLSPLGHQPMVHPETGDQIIFNGEIYNFKVLRQSLEGLGATFRGNSDTEVLLHALVRWGPACLPRVQGMYAFAYYNAKQRTLLIARDSVGIKPLYVAESENCLLLASEVRAILATGLVDRHLDPVGLAGVLAYGAVQQPATLFKGIRCFPPGCFQMFDVETARAVSSPTPFWTYPSLRPEVTEEWLLPQVRETLDASVRDHLVSDVPVGVFLSSGLDSTILAGLAARHTVRLKSFCVGFGDQPDLSEQPLAAETARRFGLEHTYIQVNGADAERVAVDWFAALDQPSVDGLNVYVISQVVRRLGITVALSGQGGDELFGGYASFRDVPALNRLMRVLGVLPPAARSMLGRMASVRRSDAVKQKLQDIMRSSGSIYELYLQRRRMMSDEQLDGLGIDPRLAALGIGFQPADATRGMNLPDDPIAAVSQLECRFYQGNMLLRDSDVNGMAHSLEIRVPILDQRVLDLMLPVPGHVRLPAGRANKHLLRQAFPDLLRPELLAQGKRGFTLPIRRWMVGHLRGMCEEAIASLKGLGMLRPEGVDRVWQAFLRNPESPIWTRAFMLCVLGVYVKQHGVADMPSSIGGMTPLKVTEPLNVG